MRGLITEDAVSTDLQQAREAWESLVAHAEPPAGTHVRSVTAGGVQSLVVSAREDARPTVLYLHGGGYIVGSAFGYRSQAGAVAVAAQAAVLVPDYRLAPENPFPAALEDSLRAYRWLIRQTSPEDVVVVGVSSGGGLAMSLLLKIKEEQAALPGAAVLFCPWLDLAERLPAESHAVEPPMPSKEEVRVCTNAYLAGHPLTDPIVDPLSADLTGLPPMLIQAATGDAQLADAKALAALARKHGVDARLELFPVDAHAFQLFWSFLPEAADAIDMAGNYIRELQSTAANSRQQQVAR
jgi:acetyl esterase/lipase